MTDEEREFTDEDWLAVRRGEIAPPTPRRYKNRDEFTVEEELHYRQGHTEPIETPAYQRARDEALRAAGLLDDDGGADEDELSIEGYLRKIQAKARP
jgi:hypothetical protein